MAVKAKDILDSISGMENRLKGLEEGQKALRDETSEALKNQSETPSRAFYGPQSDSVESQALSYFGTNDVQKLLITNTAAHEFRDVPLNVKMYVRNLKEKVDIARMAACRFGGEKEHTNEWSFKDGAAKGVPRLKSIGKTGVGKALDIEKRLMKAMATDAVAAGAEWIPNIFAATYIEEYELPNELASALETIPMPHSPYTFPLQIGQELAEEVDEGAAAVDNDLTTDNLEFNARKMVKYYLLPEELEEEAAVSVLALARQKVVQSHKNSLDRTIISGDILKAQDPGITYPARTTLGFWDGLRKRALANEAANDVGTVDFNSGVTTAKLDLMIAEADRFGVNPGELLFLLSPKGYAQIRGDDRVSTLEKIGPSATVLTGSLAAYGGVPIIISSWMPQNMDATGVVPATPGALSGVLLVNKTRFMVGIRRPLRLIARQDMRAEYDRWQVVGYQRVAFQGLPQSAGETSIIYGINVIV